MAVTSKKAKGRIDFGAALDDALYIAQDSSEHGNLESNDENVLAKNEDIHVTKEEPHSSMERNDVVDNKNVMETNALIESIDDDDDIFLSLVKGDRGVQRSVYFESNVYSYIQRISTKYGVNFSNVVNLLLKDSIGRRK